MELASFGEVDAPFLVANIPQAQAGEYANIVGSLHRNPAAAKCREVDEQRHAERASLPQCSVVCVDFLQRFAIIAALTEALSA